MVGPFNDGLTEGRTRDASKDGQYSVMHEITKSIGCKSRTIVSFDGGESPSQKNIAKSCGSSSSLCSGRSCLNEAGKGV